MLRAHSGVDAQLKVSTHAEQTSTCQLPGDSSAFRVGVADVLRGASSTRWSTPCCSSCCGTLEDRSTLEKRGFPMPIIDSVLRSRCGSDYPLLSVSDSKSNASFILTGDITGSRTLSDLSSSTRRALKSRLTDGLWRGCESWSP